MNEDCRKLTVYLGERDRFEGRFVADVLTDIYTWIAENERLVKGALG